MEININNDKLAAKNKTLNFILIENEVKKLYNILEYVENKEDFLDIKKKCENTIKKKFDKINNEIYALDEIKQYIEKQIDMCEIDFLKEELKIELNQITMKIDNARELLTIFKNL